MGVPNRSCTRHQVLALAASAKLDAFEKVKKMIDEMVTVLKKDQEDEVSAGSSAPPHCFFENWRF